MAKKNLQKLVRYKVWNENEIMKKQLKERLLNDLQNTWVTIAQEHFKNDKVWLLGKKI